MRCRCCDAMMSHFDMRMNEETGKINDVCSKCVSLSRVEYNYVNDKEYQLADAQEGPTPKKSPIY